ncbi:MAG: hypothetical protein AB1631_08170 [Acidobacteriota bacterium]
MSKEETLRVLQADLTEAFNTPKCRKCHCLTETMESLREEFKDDSGEKAERTRAMIAKYLEGMNIQYNCIGCDPCLPAVAANKFYQSWEGNGLRVLHQGCGPTLQSEWPPIPGEYKTKDPHSSVATCVLVGDEMYEQLKGVDFPGLAIIGKTLTENLGIERLVQNIIANPYIRFLLLVGAEAEGHRTGQTILALSANGVNEKMRVIGSEGKRPVLRNLSRLEVERFREQVSVIDLIGCANVSQILEKVRDTAEQNPGPLAAPFQPPQVPRILATPPEKLKLDKAGFFIIIPQPERGIILCEHYQNNGTPNAIIEGCDAATIYYTAIERGLVAQLDHAAYLGKELAKAELSLQLGFRYRQDAALGELDPEAVVEW